MELLEGWKQIAFYPRVCEKTAQKWANRRRMPIHHLPGSGRVVAHSQELDAWKLTVPAPAPVPIRHANTVRRRAIMVRLPEDVLTTLRPLIEQRFSSMQEFLSHAVAHYAEHALL